VGDPAAVRIGIFGGTFDPIHTAHLEVAEAVRGRLGLDRMLLMVANQPWQKVGARPLTPAEDRFAMVEAAVADWPGLEPSRMEIDRGGPTYTIDTVRQLLGEEPGAEVTVVVGSDVVGGLTTWKDEVALREAVTLAVVGRPGVDPVAPPPGWRTVQVPVAPFDVSSTELRRRLEAGLPVEGWVPEPVVRCIARRGLYATGR
jgi:nicotinate-nucleotide adenylyltransferase